MIYNELVSVLARGMNTSIDPCNDFYEYACGNWAQYNQMPEDKISWTSLSNIDSTLRKQVKSKLRFN